MRDHVSMLSPKVCQPFKLCTRKVRSWSNAFINCNEIVMLKEQVNNDALDSQCGRDWRGTRDRSLLRNEIFSTSELEVG